MKIKRVCVLGAGIVGLTTAYELNRKGFEVTVVDGANLDQGVAWGASRGNGAQLSYSYVQPLADESIWRQLPKLLLSPESPLKVRPQWDWRQWHWGLNFLRACNQPTAVSTTMKLLNLAGESRAGFNRLLAEHPIECDYSTTGKLVLYSNAASFQAAQRQMSLQSTLGCHQQSLNANAAIDLEPALEAHHPSITGAIYTPSECAVDCFKLCQALERLLRLRGVQFEMGSDVKRFDIERKNDVVKIIAANTRQRIEADIFILSIGSDSPRLASTVGVSLPVYPIKGYSVNVNVGAAHKAPTINITDAARKVVFARLGDRLRVAGMAHLMGHNRRIEAKAIDSLWRTTSTIFPQLKTCDTSDPWSGLRPATPTGLPIVGVQAKGPRNLVMNTGHGALGLTLAFGTALRVADLCARNLEP